MKPATFVFFIFLASCTRETYETRLEIQNNLDNKVNCIIYPKSGIHISPEPNFYIDKGGAFEIIYKTGGIKKPTQIIGSIVDSIQIFFSNAPDTNRLVLLFNPSTVKNYKSNLFTDPEAWTCSSSVLKNFNPPNSAINLTPVKLHIEQCIFEINKDSIIYSGK